MSAPANEVVYVIGRVTYKDELGTIRSTAFCRRWDPVVQRFFPIEDPTMSMPSDISETGSGVNIYTISGRSAHK